MSLDRSNSEEDDLKRYQNTKNKSNIHTRN